MKTPARLRSERSTHQQFRLSPIAAGCAALLMMAAGSAGAADAPQAAPAALAPATSTVVVTGMRRSLEDSINIKRTSDSIVEAVSAEELGKLPDASIAEALARLPGVTGQRGGDGRVNVISIRGLSPEFSGALLNGREMVSSSDARAVEYDQFPSELIGSAVVYKTPDASLIGQGLSGTVDLRTRRPLATRGREMALNVRGEKNSGPNLVPGITPAYGSRLSFSYIDQFANNTIGVALGFARLDEATQVRKTELAEYGSWAPYGVGISPVPDQLHPANGMDKALLPMFWGATQSSKRNTRDGLMAVLEYKPNRDLHSTLDLYYSKFDTHEAGAIFRASMFNAWGVPIKLSDTGTTQVGQNTFVTSGNADRLQIAVGNTDTRRRDSIGAFGWNTELKLADKWRAMSDLSYSRDTRSEDYSEVYAAPYDKNAKDWIYGGFHFNTPLNGAQTFTPLQNGFLSKVSLGDPQNYVPDQPAYTGTIRSPKVKDELKSLRLQASRELDGLFRSAHVGFNYTERDKNVTNAETRLLLGKDASGAYVRDVPAGALGTPIDMGWAGIASIAIINVPQLVALGAVTRQPRFSQKVNSESSVSEKVSTMYGKLDIETEVGHIPLRGNVGVQAIHTEQQADGVEYRGNDVTPDINLLVNRNGGASYTDYLPSLNLIAELPDRVFARFGLAKTMARPNIVSMRAGVSTPTIIRDVGRDQGKWTTAYGGNPELQPWRANSIDLSLEKYFGKRSYVSVAAFRKNLLNYVFDETVARDNSFLPVPADLPAGIKVQQYGPFTRPSNGQGGSLHGLELSAALEGGLLTAWLENFGVVASGSRLGSNISDKDGKEIKLNGLSGTTTSLTGYYENQGFSARVSQRYRAAFTATTRDIYLQSVTTQEVADRVIDLQLGYAIDSGRYKGLSFLFQINNLRDRETQNLKSVFNAPDPTMLRPAFTYHFGRQMLLGVNYKF